SINAMMDAMRKIISTAYPCCDSRRFLVTLFISLHTSLSFVGQRQRLLILGDRVLHYRRVYTDADDLIAVQKGLVLAGLNDVLAAQEEGPAHVGTQGSGIAVELEGNGRRRRGRGWHRFCFQLLAGQAGIRLDRVYFGRRRSRRRWGRIELEQTTRSAFDGHAPYFSQQ